MDKSKKRKPQYAHYNQKRKRAALESGLKGYFCSCNEREKECINESYNILNEYADKLYGVEGETTPTDNENKDDMDELLEEIQAIKSTNQNRQRRFQVIESGAKNIIFIRTTIEDPVKLAQTIIEDIAEKKQQRTRFLLRLVPIEVTCKAYLDDIKKAFETLLQKYFQNDSKSFSIVYNHRNNNNLSRDEVIAAIADMIVQQNSDHKVDLKNAEISVVIEVIRNNVLLSVIPNFIKYKKYNLHTICEDACKIDGNSGDSAAV